LPLNVQLGDKRILALKCKCKVAYEGVEEPLPRFGFDTFDNRPKSGIEFSTRIVLAFLVHNDRSAAKIEYYQGYTELFDAFKQSSI
jgi:hypothetical protein